MQRKSTFQHNALLLASIIIVQLVEGTAYSLHWHLANIQNSYSSKNEHRHMQWQF